METKQRTTEQPVGQKIKGNKKYLESDEMQIQHNKTYGMWQKQF